MAQKAIIIQGTGSSSLPKLSVDALNKEFADGWRFISANPFGMASSHGGGSKEKCIAAALLVVLEK